MAGDRRAVHVLSATLGGPLALARTERVPSLLFRASSFSQSPMAVRLAMRPGR